MAKLALTVIGGIGGFLIGGPMGAQIGMMIGGMVGGMLFGPTTEGPRINDLTVSASTYGNAIPRLYGTARMSSNMIWSNGIKEHKKKSTVGKGGQKTVSYSYTASFAVAFCVGEVDKVMRIWADSKVIYSTTVDVSSGTYSQQDVQLLNSNKKNIKYTFRVYPGSEDQMPDAKMESIDGVGNVPAYRGLCYIFFEDMPLEDFGNRIPQISAEISHAALGHAPVVKFNRLDGSDAGNLGSLLMDYPNNRLIQYDGYNQHIYSLNTLKELTTSTLSRPDNAGGGVWGYAYGADGTTVTQFNQGRNSGVIGIYDSESGALIDHFGTGARGNGFVTYIGSLGGNFGDRNVDTVIGGFCGIIPWKIGGQKYITFNGFFGDGMTTTIDGRFVEYFWGRDLVTCGQFDDYAEFAQVHLTDGLIAITVQHITKGYGGIVTSQDNVDLFGSHFTTYQWNGDAGGNRSQIYGGRIKAPYGTACTSISNVIYVEGVDGILIIGNYDKPVGTGTVNTGFMAMYSFANGYTQWASDTNEAFGYGFNFPAGIHRLSGSSYGWVNVHGELRKIDLGTGLIKTLATGVTGVLYPETAAWDDHTESLTCYTNDGSGIKLTRIYGSIAPGEVSVGGIVSDILTNTGLLTLDDIDTSQIDSLSCTGYVISREATARDCINQLASAYFFDGVESDYQIKITKRGLAPVMTLTQSELANMENRDIQVKETLAQEVELPMRFTVNYLDKDRNYQQGSQFAKRSTQIDPTVNTRKEVKAELPIVFLATEAKQIADKMLKMVWANRITVDAKLPWRFMTLDPTDTVRINLDNGSSRVMRIAKLDTGADMSLSLSGPTENQVSYTSAITSADSGVAVPASLSIPPPPATPLVFNTPLLKDAHDTAGKGSLTYVSAFTAGGGFRSAAVEERDSTGTWVEAGLVAVEPVVGFVTGTLPATKAWNTLDTTTHLNIRLYDTAQTLSSITYDQLMAGQNMAIIGNEVIQFQTAVLNTDGSYTISNILRARRGTNTRVATHVENETFFFLQDGNDSITAFARVVNTFSEDHAFRAVVPSSYPDLAKTYPETLIPEDLRPYTLEDYIVTDDGTTVTIVCHRRSRITFGIVPGISQAPYVEGVAPRNAVAKLYAGLTETSALALYGTAKRWEDIADTTRSPHLTGTYMVPVTLTEVTTGTFGAVTFTIPYSTTTDSFVLETYEQGYADGMIKAMQFKRGHVGDPWDATELY